MKIETKYAGVLDIEDDQIIHFPHGLPGFQEEQRFLLMELPDGGLFQVLQSVETTGLAFVVASPYPIMKDYSVNLDEAVQEVLQIEKPEDVAIYGIVTVKDPFSASTINLKAPLIINIKERLGKQQILSTDDYATKTAIIKGEA